jgi:6,7-dimethyl-8-ribityllumazine synthase
MKVISPISNKNYFNIAIIKSQFNSEVTNLLLDSALHYLKELGWPESLVTVVEVPGAVEIPLVAQRLAQSKNYESIVCLGAVIRGETSHYDYVCSQVSTGCQQVMLQYHLPVVFGVLTTENDEQALARASKGKESIQVAIDMYSILKQIS